MSEKAEEIQQKQLEKAKEEKKTQKNEKMQEEKDREFLKKSSIDLRL